ncbi:helix-turn-helix domain-containing protein [Halalkalibacter krulwichiae]|uniref:Carbohydrate diacid transcriptional activator CdaR n=1 Tax=Halalkalibacter krulwichiae TaxID=199441 RepID=A0A1X9MEP9_9BACI|nr:helix-turn-helix domain-containing protein [Halalkalibacter krulwichiae]ARK30603.1 carbohydrate diacid transcriptional activator CdaR [Halalkalibacter krulwichiae]
MAANKEVFLNQLSFENKKALDHVMNLMESFRAMNSTLELDEVLKKIMHYALNIVETAEAGYIQMLDESSNKLIIKASVGFNDNISFFKVNVGESITGKVFRDGCVRLISSREEIYNSMGDLSRENFDLIDTAHYNNQNIKSILAVPVSFGKNRIGVMTLHCFDIEDGISEIDLHLLQSFASQAAIALYNAKLHTEVQETLNEATLLSQRLKETNILLEKRTNIHNLLTGLSVENRGLDAIILEMNKLMKSNCVYVDYVEGTFSPKHDKYFARRIDDLFLLFRTKTKPAYVTIYDTVSVHCFIYPIRSGSILLGCLIVEGNAPLSQLDHLIIEQGAPILSLEIMKRRSQTEIMYKKTYESYQQFLKIKNPKQAELTAEELGIHHHSFLQTALIELDGNLDLHSLENEALLLLSHLREQMPFKDSLLFSYNNKITVFSAVQNANQEAYWIEIIENAIKWWNDRYTVVARGGISTGYYPPGQAEENHVKAEKALLYLRKQIEKGIIHYKKIGISSFFLDRPPAEIEAFMKETFSPLWTTHEKQEELLGTLFTYIQNNRSMAATAKELHIHTNTLYHRIKKIEHLLSLDFNCYEDFLKVQLGFYLYKKFLED